jgi:murein DD-endopeptidase MepM/ murein hydrolase activator NlpD
MFALAGILLAAWLGRLVVRRLRTRRPEHAWNPKRRTWSRVFPATGLVLILALAGTQLAASTAGGKPSTHLSTPAHRVTAIDRSTAAVENRAGRSDPSAAATSAMNSAVWRDLLALERAIEDAPQGTSALVAEEKLYEGAVRDPATANTLADAAARTGDTEAITAVFTDIVIVRAALANQAAATEAQTTLALLDSMASAQCTTAGTAKSLVWPMVGGITQPFGPTNLGIEPSQSVAGVWYPHYHTGLDIAAPLGTPVRAAAGGVVIVAGANENAAGRLVGYGQYVVIKHLDGCTTLYGHLLDLTVHSADKVGQGDIVGHEGSTGSSTGPHLHFEVRVNDQPVDPMRYLP